MKVILFSTVMGLFTCSSHWPETVKEVDLTKYSGVWYEISSITHYFQKGCRCTTAEYIASEKGYIRVINRCQKPESAAKIEGKAFVVKGSQNARLKVQFFWPFRGAYNIIGLADDYSWAIVGGSNPKYLWILSRRPFMDEILYNRLVSIAKDKGYHVEELTKTKHDCK